MGLGLPGLRMPHFSFTSAWMEAMAGAATEVPPNPLQVLGSPAVQDVAAVGGVGEADGDEVSPDAVGGKQRNIRDVAHAVGRIAEDARLP